MLALLAAAKANPEDDTPRLVLADWLEENGAPALAARAQFLRLQCQSRRTAEERVRQAHLFERFAPEWLGPLYRLVRSWTSRRGLLHLEGRADVLLAPHLEVAVEAFAWVEGLTIEGVGDDRAARLAQAPWLAHVSLLHLPPGRVGDAGATALAASPYVSGLRTLILRGHAIRDAGAAALVGSSHLTSLSALSLAWNEVGEAGARALAASPQLGRLRVLNLEGNPLGAGVAALKAVGVRRPLLWIHFRA
jgi:uncharacterized protein (TIGR02996 family)